MNKPNKHPDILRLMDLTAKAAGGPGFPEEGSITQCPLCGSDKIKPEDFRDELSRKEFEISCMCQACQDKVFLSQEEY